MATSCPQCIVGAADTSILSFTYHAVKTITVEVIPVVSVFPGGSSSTSWSTSTESVTELVGTGKGSNDSATFTDANHMTWEVDGATLTYPTTYIQYLDIEGTAPTSGCAQPSGATLLPLPDTCDYGNFIVPIGVNATGGQVLPTQILDYIESFPNVVDQFNGIPLSACAPLTPFAAPSIIARHRPQKRFEQARRAPSVSAYPTPSPPISGNWTTTHHGQGTGSTSKATTTSGSTSSGLSGSNSTMPSISCSASACFREPSTATSPLTLSESNLPIGSGFPASSSAVPVFGSASGSLNAPEPSREKTSTEHTVFSSPSARPPVYESSMPDKKHKTAYIVHTITGRAIVTTVPGGGGGGKHTTTTKKHTETHDHVPTTPINSPHGGATHAKSPDSGHGHKTPGGGNNQYSNLVGGIISAAKHDTTLQVQHTGHGGNTHAVFTVGHSAITANSRGGIVFGSKTLHPGQTLTIGSGHGATTVALQTGKGGKSHLIVDGSTIKAHPGGHQVTAAPAGEKNAGPSQATFTAGGHTITAVRSGHSIIVQDGSHTSTIAAGHTGTFDGQTIVAPSRHGGSVVFNGHTAPLSKGSGPTGAIVTAGGHTFTASEVGNSIIFKDGHSTATIRDGSKTVFEGQTISVGPSGSAIIVNGHTITLSPSSAPAGKAGTGKEVIITADGHTFTAIEKSGSVILEDKFSTATVQDGSTAKFEGQTISVLPKGTAVVVNGKTIQFTASAATTDISGYISSGLGGGSPSAKVTPAAAEQSSTNGVAGTGLPAFTKSLGSLLLVWLATVMIL